MVGYLSYWQFALLVVFSFGALAFVAYVVWERHYKTEAPATVEAEDERCRGVIGSIPQWNPGVTVGDDWEGDYDDPISAIMADEYRGKPA